MAFLKVIVLIGLTAAFANARPQYDAPGPVIAPSGGGVGIGVGGGYGGGDDGASDGPASYSFSYDNNDPASGNYYGHAEQREGTNSEGEYRVLLPDGRTQIVKYKVDGPDGYRAQVSYEHNNNVIAPSGGGNVGGGGGGYQ